MISDLFVSNRWQLKKAFQKEKKRDNSLIEKKLKKAFQKEKKNNKLKIIAFCAKKRETIA